MVIEIKCETEKEKIETEIEIQINLKHTIQHIKNALNKGVF